ncbi:MULTISPECIES: TrkH family potassium uptake protein [unclassified Mycoplasma]|uniref:TrkH family potassium uptake protein n=1 Tax=unclassified Mycoplasma TaxID=2683645 RepID=UPI00211BCA3C|nr:MULTISPECIES: potassium transporter TrkG [unclassified Mycoplasma]UUM20096.1 TrkH family potassium uptake protein [Mycoplasma sp. 1578d]UUM25076.1 TrkH family potassium uptake protein [Mycoplasma sp. 3686d]
MNNIKGWFKKSWFTRPFDEISKFKKNTSKLKYLLFVYFLVVIISALMLWSPIAQNLVDPVTKVENVPLSFVDALFTASSAFSDTGLTVKATYSQFNIFGQFLLAILIFSGGIGIFAIKLFVFNFIFRRKNISLSDANLVQSERGGNDSSKVINLVIASVKFLVVITITFGFLLSIYFYYANDNATTPGIAVYLKEQNPALVHADHYAGFQSPRGNWSLAFRFGFFHTVSAINNAGFDIISNVSLMPYYNDYFLQICFIILFIIGGLGYPVLYDIYGWFKHKISKNTKPYNFTLFSKLSLIIYFLVFVVGFSTSLIFETLSKDYNTIWNKYYVSDHQTNAYRLYIANNSQFVTPWKDPDGNEIAPAKLVGYQVIINNIKANGPMYGNTFQKIFAILFISLSTRSAGFYTALLSDFTFNSYITYSIMMFIGAAPSSTGGGIRTTTFALVILTLFATFKGDSKIRLFGRSINKDNCFNALKVFIISLFLIILATIICVTSFDVYSKNGATTSGTLTDQSGFRNVTQNYRLEQIVFEICSAFGTTGLSLGITPVLNDGSKITLTIVMFIGQFGVSSLMFVWKRKKRYNRYYEYIEEDVAIG